jgi:hypothetical protein
MLSQIADFVNWLRLRNPAAFTWRDYSYDLLHFARAMGESLPGSIKPSIPLTITMETDLQASWIAIRIANLSSPVNHLYVNG